MQKDYLAIIQIGGGSSFARSETIFDAVEHALRVCVLDWSRYYKLDDKDVGIAVYDVTGMDALSWDHASVYCTDTDDCPTVDLHSVVRVQTPPLGKRQKITAKAYLAELATAVGRACSFEPDQPVGYDVARFAQLASA